MKRIYFILLSLISINHVLAQLTRKIKINQVSEAVTIAEELLVEPRTMRSYRTQGRAKMARRTTTESTIIDKTCLLKPDVGPCRSRIPMWFFEPTQKNCSTFYWGGCQGNGNRFDTRTECEATCVSTPGWKQSRPRYCSLAFDYGWCFGADERYFYDKRWGVCKKTIYSGCGGNKNNFYSKEKCEDVCRLASFLLKPLGPKADTRVKKILIINPNEFTEPTMPGGGPTTQSTKKRTGSWWVSDFNMINPNKKYIDPNREKEEDTTARPRHKGK